MAGCPGAGGGGGYLPPLPMHPVQDGRGRRSRVALPYDGRCPCRREGTWGRHACSGTAFALCGEALPLQRLWCCLCKLQGCGNRAGSRGARSMRFHGLRGCPLRTGFFLFSFAFLLCGRPEGVGCRIRRTPRLTLNRRRLTLNRRRLALKRRLADGRLQFIVGTRSSEVRVYWRPSVSFLLLRS